MCVEFIIATIAHSPSPSEIPLLPIDEKEMYLTNKWASGEPLERRGKGPWSVVLWSDDKHVLKEVTRQIRDALGLTWEDSEVLARQVEELVSLRYVGNR